MTLLIAAAVAMSTAPTSTGDVELAWPEVPSGEIRSMPDWSDYRIYPKEALSKEQEGAVFAQLLIDRAGKPSKCRVLRSSGHEALDAGTCNLMMTMLFEPALDPARRPTASTFSRKITWLLTDPRRFASSSIRAQLSVRDGTIESCEVVEGSGPYLQAWAATACKFFSDLPYYLPAAAASSGSGTIEARLDAGDRSPLLSKTWPDNQLVASNKVKFRVNKDGDATECKSIVEQGFGTPGLNNRSSCGPLLSSLWFAEPPEGSPQGGSMETRVYWKAGD